MTNIAAAAGKDVIFLTVKAVLQAVFKGRVQRFVFKTPLRCPDVY